jgi:hypothetical protein
MKLVRNAALSAAFLSLAWLSPILLPPRDGPISLSRVADHSRIGVLRRVASAATLSRAVRDGRIRRLGRGVFTADQRADPAELIARNRWMVVAGLVPDAVVADRSAAEGGTQRAGVLTVASKSRKEDLVLPGLGRVAETRARTARR